MDTSGAGAQDAEGFHSMGLSTLTTAETIASEPGARASGRMVIEIGKDRRIIVDAGVDAAALGRVLAILERR